MNFEFSDDQKMLKDQVRRFLETASSSQEVRTVLDNPDKIYNEKLWSGLKDMGLMGTAIPEAYGGVGAGYLELCVVAEELGRHVAPVPFSSSIYLAAEAILAAGTEDQKQKYLPGLASGDVIGTFAAVEGSGRLTPASIKASVSGDKLSGTKTMVPDGSIADLAVVIAGEGGRLSLYIVDLKDASVTRTTRNSIDPARDMAELSFNGTPAERLGAAGEGFDLLTRIYDRAAVLFAFEQLGGALKALESAVDYSKERYAFGRQIGSFQALKHMMADMYVSAELARSNCYYGAWALSSGAEGELPEAAATARLAATKAYQHCAKDNIQVHGGMGFTWEFDCHLHYRRANLLALVLGAASEWEDKVIARLEDKNAA